MRGPLMLAGLVVAWAVSVRVIGLAAPAPAPGDAVYPGTTWASRKPAEVGMDAEKLKAFAQYVGGRGCVVRHGYMVHTWGDQSRRADVASACKPWIAHFLFKAVEAGKLTSVEDLATVHEPRLRLLNEALGFKDRAIRWRHLACQTSCYGVREAPGKAYDYSDFQMAFFFDTLFLKVYGSTWKTVDKDVLHPKLTDLLQCQDNPTFMAFGTGDRPGRVGVSVRDFCRFGLLYLRKGNWKGTQLISAEHAATAVSSPVPNTVPRTTGRPAAMIPGQRSHGGGRNQTDHLGSYSYTWWTNGVDRHGKRHWPNAPTDTYGAFGHGGPRAMVVIPSLDLVVSWNDSKVRGRDRENRALKRLAAAVTDTSPVRPARPRVGPAGTPMPGQIVVDPTSPAWLVRYDPGGQHKPFFMCGPGDPEGFLYRGTRNPDGTRTGDQLALIRKLAPTGANCIYLMAVRSHGGDGDPTHNPFIDNDPSKGLNAKVLDQWETWFAAMDKHGIVTFFFLYDDSARIWDTGDVVGPEEKRFLHGLVKRFKHHKHLIWCVAEEFEERFSTRRASNIAAEIRAADDHRHAIAVHQLTGLRFKLPDDPNVDQFAMQYNAKTAEDLHAGIAKAFNDAKGRYNLNMSEIAYGGIGTGDAARRKVWAMAMAGAYVMLNGMDIVTTAKSDLQDCGRLVRFFESANVNGMAPHDELKHAGTDYVLARPGRAYIAYAAELKGRIGLKGMTAGTYTLTWLDCVTGRSVIQRDVKVPADDCTWRTPAGIGDELAAHLERTSPPARSATASAE